MFPAEGHSYGIFSGLDALGQEAPSLLSSRIKSGQVTLAPISSRTTLLAPAPIDDGSGGGGMPLYEAGPGVGPAVAAASDNTVLFLGLGVAIVAIGGALYLKKRKKAA